MLYFRFDNNKEDFKGEEHKSVLFGDEAYEIAYIKVVENEEAGEYTERVKEARQKEFDGEIEDSSDIVESIVNEYIENECTLNGCSCFELSVDGLKEAENYGHIYERNIITIFDGEYVGQGHDGENVAHCNKIIYQESPENFNDILLDFEIDYEEKLKKIMELIKK